ncbi:MAG TPA: Ig-like domain-containing protein [Cyclobacteriaceae bacterium]
MNNVLRVIFFFAVIFTVPGCDNNDNEPGKALPGIGITAPADKSTFTSGIDIKIQAFATEDNGPVARMDFYEGTNKLGEDMMAPYEYVWQKVETGEYTISVTSVDDQGTEVGSTSITITVVDPG